MRRSRLGTVVLALAIALLGSLVVVPSAQAAPGDTMVASVNASRRAAGLAPYAVRADLVAVALGQAQRMAAANRLYHNPNLATDVKNYAWAGENVGYGPDLVTLHQAFMNSPAHRANILSARFTEIGIAVVAKDGVLWVAEVFRRPWSAGSTASTAATTTTKTTTTTTAPRPAATKTAASKAAATPVRSATPSPKPVAAKPTQPPVVPVAASTAPKPTAAPPAPAPAPSSEPGRHLRGHPSGGHQHPAAGRRGAHRASGRAAAAAGDRLPVRLRTADQRGPRPGHAHRAREDSGLTPAG